MKTSLKIAVLFVALATMTACSAQKRAERLVRRAVALCPELVQMKAHTIDTVLTTPVWADCTKMPLSKLLDGDTVYAATEHGTVVVSLSGADSSLRVGFVAAPQEIHYKDKVEIPQVAIEPAKAKRGAAFWSHFAICLVGLFIGMGLFSWLLFYIKKKKE